MAFHSTEMRCMVILCRGPKMNEEFDTFKETTMDDILRRAGSGFSWDPSKEKWSLNGTKIKKKKAKKELPIVVLVMVN
jgi:hypothetical protein